MFAASAAAAEPVRLVGDALQTTVSEAMLEIDAPLGNKLPVRFQRNGLVAADAGPLAAYLGSKRDRGRWWVDESELCVKWFRWFEAKPRCLSIWRDGARIHWREREGESGTATLIETVDVALADAGTSANDPPVHIRKPAAVSKAKAPTEIVSKASDKPSMMLAGNSAIAAKPPHEPSATGTMSAAPHSLVPSPNAATVDVTKPVADVAASNDAAPVARAAASLSHQGIPKAKTPTASAENVSDRRSTADQAAEPAPPITSGAGAMRFVSAAALVALTSRATTPSDTVAKPATVPPSSAVVAKRIEASAAERRKRAVLAAQARAAAPPPPARAGRPRIMASAPRTPTYMVVRVAAGDVLNVRSGPSEYHAPVGLVRPDSRSVRIVGRCRDSWCPIQHGTVTGWVNSYYLSEERAEAWSSVARR
ncbi:MAG: SH3 domain-containing protein [Hyphomicrobiaceae bacterium]|nr:SH3 domain-containing protein [Hyphomicrobiaceae bacterium]